jgi:hypothetical protein
MPGINEFKALFSENDLSREYKGLVYRLVETQEIAATTKLVDDLEEQFLLEQMLDEVKPLYRSGTEHMHYLLKTPFRYPPLKQGSRFGSRLMASFFYASEQTGGALAEVAFYRFVFLSHMQSAYPDSVRSQHLLFSVKVASSACMDLTDNEFALFQPQLRSPDTYSFCQQVGHYLITQQRAELLRYASARDPGSDNVAIYAPAVIRSKEPEKSQSWLCLTQQDKVSFTRMGGLKPISFAAQYFWVNGQLPMPA